MECRAHNAEKESQLLKGQLDDLKKQFNEVYISYFSLDLIFHLIVLSLINILHDVLVLYNFNSVTFALYDSSLYWIVIWFPCS